MTTISVETVYVLAMSGLMGLFLLGMWWEARRALREMCDENRVFLNIESEREFLRQMAREDARCRLNDLRAEMRRAETTRAALVQEETMGPEHIGRILDRLARIDTRIEGERVPELNFVRGGARNISAGSERSKMRMASDSRSEDARESVAPWLAAATR